jgi:hypothetical protein
VSHEDRSFYPLLHLIPLLLDAFMPEVDIATLELLERFGHEVE